MGRIVGTTSGGPVRKPQGKATPLTKLAGVTPTSKLQKAVTQAPSRPAVTPAQVTRLVRKAGLQKPVAQAQAKVKASERRPNVIDDVLGAAKAVGNAVSSLGQKQYAASSPQGVARQYRTLGKEIGKENLAASQQSSGVAGAQFARGIAAAGKATVEHPGKVAKATLKSIPGAVEGIVAGPVELAANPAKTLKGIREDYNRRYGPQAGKAVQQEGLLPYGLDVATAAVPIGRATGLAAKAGALGKAGERIMAERPGLREGPQRVVPQERSPNFFKAAGQQAQDVAREKGVGVGKLRVGGTLKRQNKGTPRGVEPQGPNEVVPVSKRAANRKLEQSFGVQSNLNRNLHAQGRQELRDVFEKQVPKTLTKDQVSHGALRYAVAHGIRTPEQASVVLPKLRQLILDNRTGKPISDELPHIDWLIKHPNVFNEPLAGLADRLRGLGAKLGANDPRLTDQAARERVLTPQAVAMGIEPRKGGILNPVTEAKQAESMAAFEKRVAAARGEHGGLAEPGYFPDVPFLKPRLSDYVRGTGVHGAIKGPKQTEYTLMRQGAAVVHPRALQDALARNLKSQFNVNHVANTVASFAADHVVDRATGERIPVRNLTYHQIDEALAKSGVRDLVPYRPGTVFEGMHGQGEHPDPAKFIGDAYRLATNPQHLANEKGWYLIPREIDKQMRASLKGNGLLSRLLAKNKSLSTTIILGQNPSWPFFRVGHNLLTSAVFNVNPLKALEGARKLSPEEVKALKAWTGSDPFHYDRTPPRVGAAAAPESPIDALRAVATSDTKTGKAIRAANPAAWARQIARPAMAAERHQMAFFRFAAAYQKLSKDAKAKVARDVQGLTTTLAKARGDLTRDPQYMESLAHHVNEIYGDFANYPGIQKGLSQNVMFYGYLRYATRVLLKTLPAKHPIKANILFNLSRQNEQNTRDILGLKPGDPLPFGAEANVYSRNAKGELEAQNLHRANPFGAASLEGISDPRRVLTSEAPYLLSELATQGLNIDLLRRHGLRVEGKAQEKGLADHISIPDRARIMAEDFLRMSAPYRTWDNIVAGGQKMGNDSLAFSPRPIVHKQTQAITNDLLAQQFGKRVGVFGNILKSEAPFLKLPSRDDVTALQVKQNAERLAGKNLTPAQKAAEQRRLEAQPGYAQAFARGQVLAAQRRKPRARSGGGNAIDSVLGGGGNAIDAILGQ